MSRLALGRLRVARVACDSTSDEVARLAGLGAPAGTVVTAREQRRGRGRLGRTWASPAGNLYLSLLLRPALAPAAVPPITLAVGVAVAEVATALGAAVELKWPNDVLCRGKKLAGILTEMASRGGAVEHVVIGIGLNLGGALPDELAASATTLEAELGRAVDRAEVVERLLAALDRRLAEYLAGGVAAVAPAWLGLAHLADRRIRAVLDGCAIEGRGVGLDPSGRLELVDDRGHHYYVAAGEITVVA